MSISNVATASMTTSLVGKRIVVLGGGLSGLSYMHYMRNFLKYFNKTSSVSKLTLLEANDYMGGSVKSKVHKDNIIHELGPRSIRTQGVRARNTLVLLEELKLDDKCLYITPKSGASKNRYVYNNNQLLKMPITIGKLLYKLPGSTKATLGGAIFRDMFKADKMNLDNFPHRDPSVYEFVAHRFGEEAADKMADPIMRGITAGDARKLSSKALLQDLVEKEQAYGSVLRGVAKAPVTKMMHDDLFPNEVLNSELIAKFTKEDVVSYNLKSGLQTIPEHLSNSLLNTNDDNLLSIYNQTKVISIIFNDPQDPDAAPCTVKVETVDGDIVNIDADHIVSSIPASELAKILPDQLPSYYSSQIEGKNVFESIIEIPHVPVGCVCVEYRDLNPKSNIHFNSFGFLSHSKAGSKVLGISFDSTMFPEIDKNEKSFRMTCMIGGAWFEEIFQTNDVNKVTNAQLEQISLEEINKILKIKKEPHRMTALMWKTGIAQYRPGHKDRMQKVRADLKKMTLPITLLGQSYDGIAINDVIFASRMAANDFVKTLDGQREQ